MLPFTFSTKAVKNIRKIGPEIQDLMEGRLDPELEKMAEEERLPWIEGSITEVLVGSGRFTPTGARVLLGKFPKKPERRLTLLRYFWALVTALKTHDMLDIIPSR
jgi:hypothetical protein